MDVATVLTLVQTLLQLLDSPISSEIESLWGYNSQLQNLRNTMSTILAVLSNVERLQSQQLPISIPQVTLERLQDAVYQADDLLDEAATVSHLKQLMPGNKLSKEVRLFFSRFNQLHYAFTKSRQITQLRQILDVIAQDHRDFGAMIPPPNNVEVSNNINSSSRETHSFLCEEDMIIGRNRDKQILKDMLLETSVEDKVAVVSIVGIGGLGKTALAKLLYNDAEIKREFSPHMWWVCVSDDFDLRSLLAKILAAATHTTLDSGLSMDELHIRLQQQLERNKYLLVLDDVWNEDHVMKWNQLRHILMQGGRGSRIIVTTRSLRVAELAKSHLTHELQGVSDEDSWELFQKETQMGPHLVEIGKEIVDKCSNVPLAIRFVASLLQGQSDRVWHSLKNTDLAHIIKQDDDGNDDGILPVLKISYNHLPPHLKSCFSYCAIYPKDYKIRKVDLINQWMAHGFIKSSSNNGPSLEELGENYFMKLLQRCFFQDVKQDKITGEIWSCKMHDLVHDLAREVARTGVVLASNTICSCSHDKTRHVFIDETFVGECHLTNLKNLRTFLAPNNFQFQNFYDLHFPTNLRVLNLSIAKFDVAPVNPEKMQRMSSMVSKLLHLRYLDVSSNVDIVSLPDFITQLHNLQALNLRDCNFLKELPKDLSKLVNLRHLDILGCSSLRHMPRGMNRMTCLHKLTNFVVNNKQGEEIGKLEDLKDLNNLRDGIEIVVRGGGKCDGEEVKEGGYLINKPLLNRISIEWQEEPSVDDADALLQSLQPHPNIKMLHYVDDADALLQRLQPHINIKTLQLYYYPGVRLPRFINTPLPNLVKLTFGYCSNLEEIPAWIGCLSSLQLFKMTGCRGVKSLPDEMRHLTCLTDLILVGSSRQLKKRCEEPNGDDWPKIKHIPNVSFEYLSARRQLLRMAHEFMEFKPGFPSFW